MDDPNGNRQIINKYSPFLSIETLQLIDKVVAQIVNTKMRGGKVVVVTGSGPNLHEGVTTLLAELMNKGVVDGITTSSAVVAHEMAGTLDKVLRVNGLELGLDPMMLPKGGIFEFTCMSGEELEVIRHEMEIDESLMQRGKNIEGKIIIKAAGNMAYPMGLRTERLAREILRVAQAYGLPFETVAGWGADHLTMIGAGALRGLPVLVTVPQLVGGGGVGLAIADSMSISERCMRVSELLASADVIIESAVALTQEIHDGPFETYTGHGIWARWEGFKTYSLQSKSLVRIDLDPNLMKAWQSERSNQIVQEAIDQGLPKTKIMGIPFRMEMSGFARLEGSLPLVGDIGVIWPLIACKLAEALGIVLDFCSHPQQTEAGQAMREWIVENIRPIRRDVFLEKSLSFQRSAEL